MSTMERTISAFSVGVSVPLMKERSKKGFRFGSEYPFAESPWSGLYESNSLKLGAMS